jgi:hypothetical protein
MLSIFLISIVAISVFLYFFQERFLFHPEKLPKNFIFQYENQIVEEYNIQLTDKVLKQKITNYLSDFKQNGKIKLKEKRVMNIISFKKNKNT